MTAAVPSYPAAGTGLFPDVLAGSASANSLPPLPEYTLKDLPPLIQGVPDVYLSLALPVVFYWIPSLIFHLFDVYDLFAQYRLHTPAEIASRNKVSRMAVLRAVLLQQVIQTVIGAALAQFDPPATFGKEEYDVAVWGRRIRQCQAAVPFLLGILGIDSVGLGSSLESSKPVLAGLLQGGQYPAIADLGSKVLPGFVGWEFSLARFIYYVAVPGLQLLAAVTLLDTWQYFWHRAMHLNKWLYTNFHSHHHRLYVPYAYGALYNHPFEGFLLDTLGTGVAYMLVGMTTRQNMIFFPFAIMKTVDDHCGYALPWDPFQRITSNNAEYHDIHHQSWGIKTNFSQPFFTYWDGLLGTKWVGSTTAKYERDRAAAEKKVEAMSMKYMVDSGVSCSDSPAEGESPEVSSGDELGEKKASLRLSGLRNRWESQQSRG